MSRYLFQPKITTTTNIGDYVYWENGFSDEEIENIIALGELRNPLQATIDQDRIVKDIRISNISWIDFQEDSAWLYDKVSYIISTLNNQYYRFDLSGFYYIFIAINIVFGGYCFWNL